MEESLYATTRRELDVWIGQVGGVGVSVKRVAGVKRKDWKITPWSGAAGNSCFVRNRGAIPVLPRFCIVNHRSPSTNGAIEVVEVRRLLF